MFFTPRGQESGKAHQSYESRTLRIHLVRELILLERETDQNVIDEVQNVCKQKCLFTPWMFIQLILICRVNSSVNYCRIACHQQCIDLTGTQTQSMPLSANCLIHSHTNLTRFELVMDMFTCFTKGFVLPVTIEEVKWGCTPPMPSTSNSTRWWLAAVAAANSWLGMVILGTH